MWDIVGDGYCTYCINPTMLTLWHFTSRYGWYNRYDLATLPIAQIGYKFTKGLIQTLCLLSLLHLPHLVRQGAWVVVLCNMPTCCLPFAGEGRFLLHTPASAGVAAEARLAPEPGPASRAAPRTRRWRRRRGCAAQQERPHAEQLPVPQAPRVHAGSRALAGSGGHQEDLYAPRSPVGAQHDPNRRQCLR